MISRRRSSSSSESMEPPVRMKSGMKMSVSPRNIFSKTAPSRTTMAVAPSRTSMAVAPSRTSMAVAPSRTSMAVAPSRTSMAVAPSKTSMAMAPSRTSMGMALSRTSMGMLAQSRTSMAVAPSRTSMAVISPMLQQDVVVITSPTTRRRKTIPVTLFQATAVFHQYIKQMRMKKKKKKRAESLQNCFFARVSGIIVNSSGTLSFRKRPAAGIAPHKSTTKISHEIIDRGSRMSTTKFVEKTQPARRKSVAVALDQFMTHTKGKNDPSSPPMKGGPSLEEQVKNLSNAFSEPVIRSRNKRKSRDLWSDMANTGKEIKMRTPSLFELITATPVDTQPPQPKKTILKQSGASAKPGSSRSIINKIKFKTASGTSSTASMNAKNDVNTKEETIPERGRSIKKFLSRGSIAQIPESSKAQLPRGSTAQIPKGSNTQLPKRSISQIPKASNTQLPKRSISQIPKGSNTQIPKRSISQIPKGSNTQIPKGSNTQLPKRSISQIPKGSSTQLPKRSISQIPKGSNTQLPKRSIAQMPRGSNVQLPKGSKAQIPRGSMVQIPKGSKVQIPRGSIVQLPKRSISQIPKSSNAQTDEDDHIVPSTSVASSSQVQLDAQASTSNLAKDGSRSPEMRQRTSRKSMHDMKSASQTRDTSPERSTPSDVGSSMPSWTRGFVDMTASLGRRGVRSFFSSDAAQQFSGTSTPDQDGAPGSLSGRRMTNSKVPDTVHEVDSGELYLSLSSDEDLTSGYLARIKQLKEKNNDGTNKNTCRNSISIAHTDGQWASPGTSTTDCNEEIQQLQLELWKAQLEIKLLTRVNNSLKEDKKDPTPQSSTHRGIFSTISDGNLQNTASTYFSYLFFLPAIAVGIFTGKWWF